MLEISKRQKLEAERDGYREYIEEVREIRQDIFGKYY